VAIYCGIDWAEGHHDIVLIDGWGALVAKRRIEENLDGVTEMTAMLSAAEVGRMLSTDLVEAGQPIATLVDRP